MPIRIVPFGPLPELLLSHLKEELDGVFRETAGPITLEAERDLPRDVFDTNRDRLHAGDLLAELRRKSGRQQTRLLGITDRPFSDEREQERFGCSRSPGKAALITIHGLKPNRPDYEITERFLERTTKEALHQLGHTFGLKHCGQQRCVMRSATSLTELDRRSRSLCSGCLDRIN